MGPSSRSVGGFTGERGTEAILRLSSAGKVGERWVAQQSSSDPVTCLVETRENLYLSSKVGIVWPGCSYVRMGVTYLR